MARRKKLERRTFIQDRFEILIKRQQNGKATFNELTELDDIVNRDPELREKVIRESILMDETRDFNGPSINPEKQPHPVIPHIKQQNFFSRVKSFLARVFNSQIQAVKIRNSVADSALPMF